MIKNVKAELKIISLSVCLVQFFSLLPSPLVCRSNVINRTRPQVVKVQNLPPTTLFVSSLTIVVKLQDAHPLYQLRASRFQPFFDLMFVFWQLVV